MGKRHAQAVGHLAQGTGALSGTAVGLWGCWPILGQDAGRRGLEGNRLTESLLPSHLKTLLVVFTRCLHCLTSSC